MACHEANQFVADLHVGMRDHAGVIDLMRYPIAART
jgi:hypothetical protein